MFMYTIWCNTRGARTQYVKYRYFYQTGIIKSYDFKYETNSTGSCWISVILFSDSLSHRQTDGSSWVRRQLRKIGRYIGCREDVRAATTLSGIKSIYELGCLVLILDNSAQHCSRLGVAVQPSIARSIRLDYSIHNWRRPLFAWLIVPI